jgi:DNA polymerase-3 subunit epsilon
MLRQLLVDTETTGFEPKEGHRIIEFAALEMIERKLTGRKLHLYFNPERDIPIEATNVHGITLEQVANEPTFKQRAMEVVEFIQDAELIIHNAKFDLNFLDHHFTELGLSPTLKYASGVIDTLMLARAKFPGGKNSLDALCDRFNVDRSNRTYHGALIDCALLADVYIHLTREQISLLAEERRDKQTTPHTFRAFSIDDASLPRVSLTPDEEAAHIAYLEGLDKSSKGNCSWLKQYKPASSE